MKSALPILVMVVMVTRIGGHVCGESCHDILCNHHGCLLPRNPFVFIGDNLVLNCTLRDLTYANSSLLHFTKMNTTNINSDYQRVVSPFVLQLSRPIVDNSLNDVTIRCYYGMKSSWNVRLETDYPPRQVTNITIVVHDWSNMSVSWHLGTFLRPKNVHVQTQWTDSQNSTAWNDCDEVNETNCFLDNSSYAENTLYNISIIVTYQSLRINKSVETIFAILSDDYVKPGAVLLNEVRNVSSRCIDLEWTHDKSDSRNLVYRVTLQHMDKVAVEQLTSNMSTTVCDLTPYTFYNVSVSAKPGRAGYWSEPQTLSFRTLEDQPSKGVKLTDGSFSAENCEENTRNVLVFLVLPDESSWNGRLTNYSLMYVPSDGSRNTISRPSVDSIFDEAKLVCSLDYDVYITVHTAIGGSPPSHLHIPKQDTVKQPRNVRLRMVNSSTELFWEADDEVMSWILYWCEGKSNTCQKTLQWKMVNSFETVTTIDYDPSRIYGVSITTVTVSSGIVWSGCIIDMERVPNPPDPATVLSRPDHGLTVLWNQEKCVGMTFISNYLIQHCRGNDKDCVEATVTSDSSEFVIRDLEGGVNYTVRMRQRSESGKIGPFSQPVFAVTTGLTRSEIAGIAVGAAVVGFIILAAVLYCIRRTWLSLRFKERITLPVCFHAENSRYNEIRNSVSNGQRNSECSTEVNREFNRAGNETSSCSDQIPESVHSYSANIASPGDEQENTWNSGVSDEYSVDPYVFSWQNIESSEENMDSGVVEDDNSVQNTGNVKEDISCQKSSDVKGDISGQNTGDVKEDTLGQIQVM